MLLSRRIGGTGHPSGFPAPVGDHGLLTGLSDDDHPQYALLAGRAGNRLVMADSATTPPWAMTERSSAPSAPSTGDIYLDDGTNYNGGAGLPGFRRYNGSSWEDIGNDGGGGGSTEFDSDVIPQLTGDVTDYSGLGSGVQQYLSSDANHTVNSIVAPSPESTRYYRITNTGSFNIVFADEGAGTAANRIITGLGIDYTLPPAATLTIVYDEAADRWRIDV